MLARLEQHVGPRVRHVAAVRTLGEGGLHQRHGKIYGVVLEQGKTQYPLVPPVLRVVLSKRLEQSELLSLATLAAAEADQPEYARRGIDGEPVAREVDHVLFHLGEARVPAARNDVLDDGSVLTLPPARASSKRHRTLGRLPGCLRLTAQHQGAGPRGVRQRKAGVLGNHLVGGPERIASAGQQTVGGRQVGRGGSVARRRKRQVVWISFHSLQRLEEVQSHRSRCCDQRDL